MITYGKRMCLVAFLLMFPYILSAQPVDNLAEPSSLAIPATDEGLLGSGPIRRYPWFQKLWEHRRLQWSQAVAADQGALVFLGDSITQGWGSNLANEFPGVKVANRGISGDTTRGMLLRLKEDVVALNPAGVVILMGTNDLEEGAAPALIAGNLKLILADLKKHNRQMPIVLCRVFPSSEAKKRPSAKIREINRLFAEAVKGDSQITLLDTWTLFANADGDAKLEEFPDLLHPNALGYAKWGAALRPILATHGFLERDVLSQELPVGYESLLNGRDLTDWQFRPSSEADKTTRANWHASDPNAPPWPILTESVDFAGEISTTNGRFVAKSGRLIVTTPPEGRKIQQLWTKREFPNDFVLKLEFRASPNADSGVFLRGRQLQCRDYLLAGPYRELKKFRHLDWNELVVVVKNNVAVCTCNGELLEQAFVIPANGPIGVEGDRGQVEYRNIRIKEIKSDLPRSNPETQGVSSQAILDFVEALDKIDSVHSFMLLRHGAVVAEGWWAPYAAEDPHQLYSLSKSFTATAVGLAVAEGKLSLDDTVVSFFVDELPPQPSPFLKSMRIRDLLSMCSGHDASDLQRISLDSAMPISKQFLELPVKHKPGTHFLYNTPATYMCSAILQKVTGEKLVDYLQVRLFDPLGIKPPIWTESSEGICHGGFGLNLRTEDIARFGQLYLQKGEWNGRQLISSEWVDAATTRQTSNGSSPDSDWDQGYGYQFWRSRHASYRGDGAFGQFCIVLPAQDAVLAITSGTADMGAVMQQAWDYLLPGFSSAPLLPNRRVKKALHDRLQTLRLPAVVGKSMSQIQQEIDGQQFKFPSNAEGVESMSLDFTGDQTTLSIQAKTGRFDFVCGHGEWIKKRMPSIGSLADRLPSETNVGVAGSGAWTDGNTYQIHLCFYETPARLEITFDFDGNGVIVRRLRNLSMKTTSLPILRGMK